MAFATGCLSGNLFIIAGGDSANNAPPLRKIYALNLDNKSSGWTEVPAWPGIARRLPVCASLDNKFYLFSGETTEKTSGGINKRKILTDAYCMEVRKREKSISFDWTKLASLPKGVSAAPSPAPYMVELGFIFWGGVDEVTALYSDARSHMGINNYIISYQPDKNSWATIGKYKGFPARVTTPVVFYKGAWLYISGEIKPGIRTNKIASIRIAN